jgi:hypothetical protein
MVRLSYAARKFRTKYGGCHFMTAFKMLYTVESFKEAFESLLSLDEADHPVVAEAVRANEPVDLSEPLESASAALRTMRRIAVRESAAAVVDDITEVCPPGTVEKLGDLVAVLDASEAERDADYAVEVETLAMPVLTHPHIYADLRPTEWRGSDEIKFVPVAVVRLNFDEQVASSGDAIVFQSSLKMLSELRDSIDSAMKFFSRTVEALPAESVPDYYLQWVDKKDD